jgi:enoyl-CoA hydratase/carnithine racemase
MNSDEDGVLLSIDRGVATITLNNQERGNSWTSATSRAYFPMFAALARDPDVRAIVLTGAGRAFCVGGDGGKLNDVADKGNPAAVGHDDYWIPARIGKPVIAAVNGACFGIGLQQILCCDVRIAAEDAKFSTAYARRGLLAEFGMSWLLPRIVGVGHAMDLLLSARLVRAAEAERMRLVNRVVPAESLMDEAIAYARELAERCSPTAMRAMKQQVYADLMGDMRGAYARSEESLAQAMRSADFREGVKSWQEQRPPKFQPLEAQRAWLDLGD